MLYYHNKDGWIYLFIYFYRGNCVGRSIGQVHTIIRYNFEKHFSFIVKFMLFKTPAQTGNC